MPLKINLKFFKTESCLPSLASYEFIELPVRLLRLFQKTFKSPIRHRLETNNSGRSARLSADPDDDDDAKVSRLRWNIQGRQLEKFQGVCLLCFVVRFENNKSFQVLEFSYTILQNCRWNFLAMNKLAI